ncbi:hypothetical protein EA658_09965 [Pseudoxanthomonas winnipegensis]|uniref:Uncharacterized protein n=1 Tax=Pseudoxanthomonas winnipegensis TaxID=2480810 RepID=A0ABY1WCS4_9GAMM|nr:hypothetical protein [Pseudoxanthomonas winnipegensis]TAA19191.1 hypothetical protein EA658_09965 [Pseudoxanthomonas winnipegensis]
MYMTPNPHKPTEPRSRIIFRHTETTFRATGLTMQAFASRVADEYQARVAAPDRIVEFHRGTTVDSIVKAEKANLQIVTRFLRGQVKLPADLEESWVAALPAQQRLDCERELAQRYGFLGAKAPASQRAARALCTARSTIEFGQMLQAIAEVMADDQVTAEDLPQLIAAQKEYGDLTAELATVAASLSHAIQAVTQQGADEQAQAGNVRAIR